MTHNIDTYIGHIDANNLNIRDSYMYARSLQPGLNPGQMKKLVSYINRNTQHSFFINGYPVVTESDSNDYKYGLIKKLLSYEPSDFESIPRRGIFELAIVARSVVRKNDIDKSKFNSENIKSYLYAIVSNKDNLDAYISELTNKPELESGELCLLTALHNKYKPIKVSKKITEDTAKTLVKRINESLTGTDMVDTVFYEQLEFLFNVTNDHTRKVEVLDLMLNSSELYNYGWPPNNKLNHRLAWEHWLSGLKDRTLFGNFLIKELSSTTTGVPDEAKRQIKWKLKKYIATLNYVDKCLMVENLCPLIEKEPTTMLKQMLDICKLPYKNDYAKLLSLVYTENKSYSNIVEALDLNDFSDIKHIINKDENNDKIDFTLEF